MKNNVIKESRDTYLHLLIAQRKSEENTPLRLRHICSSFYADVWVFIYVTMCHIIDLLLQLFITIMDKLRLQIRAMDEVGSSHENQWRV